MEKYAVEIEQEQIKTSEEKVKVQQRCAACGAPLETTSNVPKCPRCGTEPFEPKQP